LNNIDIPAIHVVQRELSLQWPKLVNMLGWADFRQEVALACVKAHAQYDPERLPKGPLALYRVAAHNHVHKLFRGFVFHNNPPCGRCKKHENCDKCRVYLAYLQGMQARRNIRNPYLMEHFDATPSNVLDHVWAVDLLIDEGLL